MSILELRAYSMLTLGLTWQDVGKMTIKEVNICLKIHKELKKQESELQRNIHLNALINSNRTNKDKFIELFPEQKVIVKPIEEATKEREEILAMRKRG